MCETDALPAELPGYGAESCVRGSDLPLFRRALLPSELSRHNSAPSEGWVGFDPTWTRVADELLTRLGHQPLDGADGGSRTRDLDRGMVVLFLLSYVRVGLGRGLEPQFSASKAALLPVRDEPGRMARGMDSNHRLQVQSLATYR